MPRFVPVAVGWTFAIYVGDMVGGAFTKGRGPEKAPFILPGSVKAAQEAKTAIISSASVSGPQARLLGMATA